MNIKNIERSITWNRQHLRPVSWTEKDHQANQSMSLFKIRDAPSHTSRKRTPLMATRSPGPREEWFDPCPTWGRSSTSQPPRETSGGNRGHLVWGTLDMGWYGAIVFPQKLMNFEAKLRASPSSTLVKNVEHLLGKMWRADAGWGHPDVNLRGAIPWCSRDSRDNRRRKRHPYLASQISSPNIASKESSQEIPTGNHYIGEEKHDFPANVFKSTHFLSVLVGHPKILAKSISC